MAESVISFVAEKLYNLLIEEATFLYKVSDQVQWMQEQMIQMQAVLRDADAKRQGHGMVLWLKQVREITFDVEDVVDTYILNMHRHQKRRLLARCTSIFKKLLITHQTGEQIERTKGRLQEIFDFRVNYGIDYNMGERQELALLDKAVEERRKLAIHRDTHYFVGFKEDVKKITNIILNKEVGRRCVVSIVGMGGSGKTTLARRIYNNSDVKVNFGNCCAIVSVSQTYTIETILKDIARVLPDYNKGLSETELKEELYPFLENKKYLIILDDVWDTHVWNLIQHYLPDTNNGSRVIITTRMMNIAKFADPSTQPYVMKQLSDDESWDLFTKIVFPRDEDIAKVCTTDLMEVRTTILKKCGGLPLALVVLGGLLSTEERGPSVWCDVMDGMDWEEMCSEGNVSLQILGLSYEALPHHLKSCFLYLSCFPEDFKIDAQKLVKLWVAEGFIPDGEKKQHGRGKRKTMEATTELWLEDLVQRCLVQVVKMNASKKVVTCRIHDLLLDLATRKAEEVNFFHTCGRGSEQVPVMTRRLAIHESSSGGLSSAQKLRTLLCSGREDLSIGPLEFVTGLKLLRVLDLEGVGDGCVLPEAIGDLIHLRYLGLRGNKSVSNIPSSVGKLQNLQTLDAMDNESLKQLPDTLWKMGSLRHVMLLSFRELMPKGNAGEHLVNLQTFQRVAAGSWIGKSLGMMTNLTSLEIVGIVQSHHRALSKSLDRLLLLRMLILRGFVLPRKVLAMPGHLHLEYLTVCGHVLMDDREEEGEQGIVDPQVINYSGSDLPPNLNHMILEKTRLQQDPLMLLGTLSWLRRLELVEDAYAGEEVVCPAGGFPQLEHLSMAGMSNLRRWKVADGAMPRLKNLVIFDCKQLEALPDRLRYLTALHKLTILSMPNEFGRRVKYGGEDWPKIQHVPNVFVW